VSFVDTNVLVYAAARGAPRRDRARTALAGMAAGEPLSLSRQILREYIAAMTREQTWGQPLALAEATADAAAFVQRFVILEDGPSVLGPTHPAEPNLFLRGSPSHNANVVATMLTHGERRLLTFNEVDFRRFSAPL
jgi:predicted nucleic acid-binding protein